MRLNVSTQFKKAGKIVYDHEMPLTAELQPEDVFNLDTCSLQRELESINAFKELSDYQEQMIELITRELEERRAGEAIISALSGTTLGQINFSYPSLHSQENNFSSNNEQHANNNNEEPIFDYAKTKIEPMQERYSQKSSGSKIRPLSSLNNSTHKRDNDNQKDVISYSFVISSAPIQKKKKIAKIQQEFGSHTEREFLRSKSRTETSVHKKISTSHPVSRDNVLVYTLVSKPLPNKLPPTTTIAPQKATVLRKSLSSVELIPVDNKKETADHVSAAVNKNRNSNEASFAVVEQNANLSIEEPQKDVVMIHKVDNIITEPLIVLYDEEKHINEDIIESMPQESKEGMHLSTENMIVTADSYIPTVAEAVEEIHESLDENGSSNANSEHVSVIDIITHSDCDQNDLDYNGGSTLCSEDERSENNVLDDDETNKHDDDNDVNTVFLPQKYRFSFINIEDDDNETNYRINDEREYLKQKLKDKKEWNRIAQNESIQRREYASISTINGKTTECNPKILKQYLESVKDAYEDAFKRTQEAQNVSKSKSVNKSTRAPLSLLPTYAAPAPYEKVTEKIDYSAFYSSFSDLFPNGDKNSLFNGQFLDDITTMLEMWNIKASEQSYINYYFYAVQQSRQEVYDIVNSAMKEIGTNKWQQQPVQQHMWNLLWTWTTKVRVDRSKLLVWQRMNHFANVKQLTRKDLLGKHITRMQRTPGRKGQEFDLVPTTFVLPQDYIAFCSVFETSQYWIMKPTSSSRGRGIRIINDLTEVHYKDNVIIQKYIDRPLLLRGYKFDLRLYVLVTSFHPLEAFLYSEGFARICSERFKLSSETVSNNYIHLTNTAIHFGQSQGNDGTSKLTLELFKHQLKQLLNVDFDLNVWPRITELIVKSLCCVEEHIGSQPNSFELFGYDVMIDEDMRPWLIEVNASPSMECHSAVDQIKRDLIADTIELVNPIYFDRQILLSVLQRRRGASRHQQQSKVQMQDELNHDLKCILHGKIPRQYGQMPEKVGRYQRIAPSKMYTKACKLKHM